jgi:hypothetical protein
VADYRLYCLDGTGKLHFAEDFRAGSADEAITKARELKPDAVKCEIWQGKRLVATLGPDD